MPADTRTKRFSSPVEVPHPTFVHLALRGNRLYFTGWNLGWLPKSRWVTDQEPAHDGEIQVLHADTPFGRAAAHLIKGDNAAAIKELESVTNKVTSSAAKAALHRSRRP